MFGPTNYLRAAALVCFASAILTERAGAQTDPSRADLDFFENKIRPVLVERCFKCHSTANKQSKGGLALDSRDSLLKGGKSGPGVVPGNPDGSLLIRAIRRIDQDLKMPPGDEPLSPAQIQDFVTWVKIGVPYPSREGTNKQDPKTSIDLNQARRFWSFQPVKDYPLPKVKQVNWPAGAIDAFVLAKLEEKGMKPSASADKRALLRRATYDLTGLPPTPEEMEAFLADASPDAYAKAIDRLLASPQYGVHWGRHWLDVARYGDTRWIGAGEDRRWPFAYTYRDWVIGALNEDLPYDRFVTLQLAADQTPGARLSDRAALGFLTVGRWFVGNLHDVIDDQIDVVTRGLLGLSAQCRARCHDHKFDPISSKDYYSMYGLFAASRMPVEGTGMLAELPEIGTPSIDSKTVEEIAKLRDALDKYLLERLQAVRKEFSSPEKLEEYLLAAQSVAKKTDNDVRALAKSRGVNEQMLFSWVRYLQRTSRNPHPVFGAWHAYAALPESEFAAKAGEVAEQEKANKKTNRHVVAILSPTPASLPELAKRYVQLLLKFDAAEQASDADQEAIRQVLRNNDSPLPPSPGQAAQFMSKEEREHAVQLRRALLARQNLLSESADQYLSFQHEAAAAVAEVNDFLQKRRHELAAEIRSPAKIADYLLAAREAQGASESQFRVIAKTRKLSDLVLKRWMEYLRLKAERNDPVFGAWRAYAALSDKDFAEKVSAVTNDIRQASRHRLVAESFATAPASLQEVATRYGELIAKFNGPALATDPEQESLRQISVSKESPLFFEPDAVLDYFTRKDLDELRNKETKLLRLYLEHPGTSAHAMSLRETPRSYAQKVFVRGNPSLLGADAPEQFLAVLSGDDRQPFHKGKGRLELAQAIVDPANPLTARVMVNRVWQWHFGTGLIQTPSDFGTRGMAPSHPELLDWLARRFVADGWSLKKLHRQIMLSATYRQSSQDNAAYRATDPENRLLWRMNHRRLSFEEIRDSLLTAAGRLDSSLKGRPADLTKAGPSRRTVYGVVDRISLPGFYRYFDFPTSDAHAPKRHETIIPQQALYMMNNAFVMDQGAYLARRTEMLSSAERITSLYRLTYGRPPSADELKIGLEFVDSAEPGAEEPADPWRYGYGQYNERERRVVEFEAFPAFVNNQWRGGPQEIDPVLGRCSLNQRGGNAGRDSSLAVIRRWIAPRDGKVSITGALTVQQNSIQPSGDGIRGRVVSSRQGQLGSWLVHGTEELTDFAAVEVKRGDTIDFVVDGRGRDQFGGFTWAPVLRMEDASAPKTTKLLWDAAKEFNGKANGTKRFGTWERYAQVLLQANEFIFLD